ncbi:glyoxylase-like metal-dependent hydrolase (beta-lactamase superfamily II) [Hoeflea marina]|uniref:Glyoxylase-like metal-dependent hydrolase (Beta-lactamase superfamily II) n=1 Tax=Hoeflea marina TaxID=274592 RepID=A0A317PMC6_9HYPH|nr:MBL fold metallo-hydrolase [Hoeflea marina]PWW01916.1 glyoxylase-like metal-dependent hydrolase (beta-lactamase superfamily II) [Hoeflea marina]
MSDPNFVRDFDPAHGQSVPVAEAIVRVTANNSGPMTFHGTNSYILGRDTLAVIDPGPIDEAHWATLLAAIGGRPVSHIFVTHTHRDHSPLAARLKAETGAVTVAEGPHRAARQLHVGEINPLAESSDMDFRPDIAAAHGQMIDGDGWRIEVLHTPGHTANHAAFALDGSGIVFSGDHVMAWATSIIAPPDGAMSDYMASLDMLAQRRDTMYFPGHGGPVNDPLPFVRALKTHRRLRERAIIERVNQGDRRIAEIVAAMYRDTDPRLHGAAALSVLAHLEDLVGRGQIVTDGPPALAGEYRPG